MKRILGIVALVMLAPLVVFVLSEPPSASGAAYVVGAVILAASLVVRRHAWRVAFAGTALVAVTVIARVIATKTADVRTIDRVIDERDLAVNASRALVWTHFVHDPDVPLLPNAMRNAYDEMKKEEGALSSPFVATYLGLERPGASDVIEFHSSSASTNRDAVIFLHGSAGNFTMSCWLFARAASPITTVCPSTSALGDWWSPNGEAIVREEIASLRNRGFEKIFLAGLSNGAIGASRIAPKLAREKQIAGLILVSGAASDASGAGVPTLVVQGRNDAQIPASIVSAYARRANAHYVELDAGHFALLVDHDHVASAVRDWLMTLIALASHRGHSHDGSERTREARRGDDDREGATGRRRPTLRAHPAHATCPRSRSKRIPRSRRTRTQSQSDKRRLSREA